MTGRKLLMTFPVTATSHGIGDYRARPTTLTEAVRLGRENARSIRETICPKVVPYNTIRAVILANFPKSESAKVIHPNFRWHCGVGRRRRAITIHSGLPITLNHRLAE